MTSLQRATQIRTIFVELERLHSHYLCLALLAHAVHDGPHFGKIMQGREVLVSLLERISGNRVHYSVNAIGGVRRDLTEALVAEVRASVPRLGDLSDFVVDALDRTGALGSKIVGYGTVSGTEAMALGAVGPTLRGSGIDSDVRREEGYAAYGAVDFDVVVEKDGDARARFMVRARETRESLRIVSQLLDTLADGPIMGELKEPNLKERREVIGRVEAPRGELTYFIRSNGTNMPERVKVRTPTFANLCFLTRALKGEQAEHARAIIESIDPCLSCTDR